MLRFGTEAGTIMKSIIRILFIICLLFAVIPAKSQSHLSVDTIYGWPDTVTTGQNVQMTIMVSNTGPSPYTGTLQIAYQTQQPVMGTVGYLYFNNAPITLNAGDSIPLIPGNGFNFDSTVFKMGNNVVVVWPVATSITAIIDTGTYVVWVSTPTGLPRTEVPEPSIYPIPAKDHLIVKPQEGSHIERVRIFDVRGREIPARHTSDSDGGYIIYLEGLPSGTYILESVFINDIPVRSRFLHIGQ